MNSTSTTSTAVASAASRLSLARLLKTSGALRPMLRPGAPAGLLNLPRRAVAAANRGVQRWLRECSPASLMWLWSGGALLVGEIDYLSGPEWSFAIFYLLPVSGAAWFSGKRNALAISGLAALIWMLAELAGGNPHLHEAAILWNFSARLTIFIFVAIILSRIRALNAGLEEIVALRTRELAAETARGLAMEREIANVSHREQQRIAHELHDGLGQELGGVAFQAKLLASKLAESGAPLWADAERMTLLLNQSIARTRALSHLLDPLGIESGGLRPALSQLVDRSGEAFAIACTFEAPQELPPLGREASLNLYRVAQEAIHNAVAHGAASSVVVQVECDPQALTLTIVDNGRGFSIETVESARHQGMGLRIMRYRTAGLEGRLNIQSAAGRGCKVICSVPLAQNGFPGGF
ncbi:MAG TPA: sensor histidine kinase [Candidatus Limnocylindrales bacterium]|nr:sensor histidine kinase [Candidatus Limnocylindrales bacterium]